MVRDWALLLLAQIPLVQESDNKMRGFMPVLKGLNEESAPSVIHFLNDALIQSRILDASTSHTSLTTSNVPYGFSFDKENGDIIYIGPRFERQKLIQSIHHVKNGISTADAPRYEQMSSLSNNISMPKRDMSSIILNVDLSAFMSHSTKDDEVNEPSIAA